MIVGLGLDGNVENGSDEKSGPLVQTFPFTGSEIRGSTRGTAASSFGVAHRPQINVNIHEIVTIDRSSAPKLRLHGI